MTLLRWTRPRSSSYEPGQTAAGLWHLKPPVKLAYHLPIDWVVSFLAPRSALEVFGAPDFIDDDQASTGGLRELYWGLEAADGMRFIVRWDEYAEEVAIAADPPDARRVVQLLTELGIRAEFRTRELSVERLLRRDTTPSR